MSTPFSFQGSLSFPPDVNVPQEMVQALFSAQYDQFNWCVMNLVGSSSKNVPFGNIGSPGAKFAMVKVDPSQTASPINLQWNAGGAGGEQEIAPGGFLIIGSGAPASGLESLIITFSTNVTVRVLLLG